MQIILPGTEFFRLRAMVAVPASGLRSHSTYQVSGQSQATPNEANCDTLMSSLGIQLGDNCASGGGGTVSGDSLAGKINDRDQRRGLPRPLD